MKRNNLRVMCNLFSWEGGQQKFITGAIAPRPMAGARRASSALKRLYYTADPWHFLCLESIYIGFVSPRYTCFPPKL